LCWWWWPLLAVTVVPALAITDGEPDKDGHPYVGLMVAKIADGNVLWRLQRHPDFSYHLPDGGHCTEAPAVSAAIWFDSGYPDENPLGTRSTCHSPMVGQAVRIRP